MGPPTQIDVKFLTLSRNKTQILKITKFRYKQGVGRFWIHMLARIKTKIKSWIVDRGPWKAYRRFWIGSRILDLGSWILDPG